MKITKSSVVKASNDLVEEVVVAPDKLNVIEPECKYSEAIDLISAAIESLAEVAQDDQIAKDSIANLGVVMLDLKGGCV